MADKPIPENDRACSNPAIVGSTFGHASLDKADGNGYS